MVHLHLSGKTKLVLPLKWENPHFKQNKLAWLALFQEPQVATFYILKQQTLQCAPPVRWLLVGAGRLDRQLLIVIQETEIRK